MQDSFYGGGDGAGVGDVLTEIPRGVDAAQDDVYLVFDEADAGEGYAVGGGAVDGEGGGAVGQLDFAHSQRFVEGEAVSGVALVYLRGDDRYVGYLAQCLGEGEDSGGVDAVVVGYQYVHMVCLPHLLSMLVDDFDDDLVAEGGVAGCVVGADVDDVAAD